MTKSTGPAKKRKTTNYTVLTKVEKLDGHFPGLATEARILFDRGVSAAKTAEILRNHFPAEELSASNLSHFRKSRWIPQKEKAAEKLVTLEAIFDENGGNYGLDLAAFAKVREFLDVSKDIKDANAIRLSILKIRAQDLKEDEFELKARLCQPAQPADGKAADPAAEATKRKRVMNKIRGIFGLSPLPEDADDEEAEDPCPESDEEPQDDGTKTGLRAEPAAGSSAACAPGVTPPNGATSS